MNLQMTIYLTNGKECDVNVFCKLKYLHGYGADADGNRGTTIEVLDDVEYDIPTHDYYGVLLTEEDKKELRLKIIDKANLSL